MKVTAITYKGGACEMCGFTGHPSAFDFHHKDPSKKDFAISSGDYRAFVRLRAELDKTVLLCANCHRTLHGREWDAMLELRRQRLEEESQVPVKRKRLNKVLVPCVVCERPVSVVEGRQVVVCSRDCTNRYNEKIDWPSDEDLRALMWAEPCLDVAKRLGVMVATVRLRCKRRGIDVPATGYWSSHSRASIAAHAALEKISWPADEVLARLVWEEPMLQLGRRLGVSDVAVKKRCRARGIPTPFRGYWAKTLASRPGVAA